MRIVLGGKYESTYWGGGVALRSWNPVNNCFQNLINIFSGFG